MIYLASRSPRRRDLLHQLRVDFSVLDLEIDETVLAGETPDALVLRLAVCKAEAGLARLAADPAGPVLGADLSGRCHRVLSAVALASAAGTSARVSESRVCFRALSPEECASYAATGEPLDKAGGYGIQGRAAAFVSDLQGSYSGVVGLPLYETAELLREAGVAL
jgi:septum formation protein